MAGGKSSDNCEYSIRPPAARLRQGAATLGRSIASGGRPQRDSMTGEHQGSAMRGSPGTRRESQPPDQHGGAWRGAAPGMAKVAACPEASRAVALGRPSPSERPCRAIVRVACGIAPRDRRRPVARGLARENRQSTPGRKTTQGPKALWSLQRLRPGAPRQRFSRSAHRRLMPGVDSSSPQGRRGQVRRSRARLARGGGSS